MSSFAYYRQHVPIVQVAEALGYEWNKKAGRNPLEYKHPDHNTIVISNPKGMQRYFTRHETENRGSVIDFVRHRLPLFGIYYFKEADGINQVLARFAGIPYRSPDQKWWSKSTEPKKFDIGNFEVKTPGLSDLIYLSSVRYLSDDTLKTFLPFIRLIQPSNRSGFNIAFPYRIHDKKDFVGMEMVNYMFKGHASGSNRREGVWVADLSGLGKHALNIYMAESAIDAMSFYQLYRQKHNLDQQVFISTGGYVTDQQMRNTLKMFPSGHLNTLFDNDISGHLYDIRLACLKACKTLSIQKAGGQVHFEMGHKVIAMPEHAVSLTNFRAAMGIRPDVRVHKAEGKDFNEMVIGRALNQEKRETCWKR